eukprot:1194717-Prorocentrum_minimum.AAC.2
MLGRGIYPSVKVWFVVVAARSVWLRQYVEAPGVGAGGAGVFPGEAAVGVGPGGRVSENTQYSLVLSEVRHQ